MTPRQIFVTALLATTSCVSQGKYDKAVAETTLTKGELDKSHREVGDLKAQVERRDEYARTLRAQFESLSESSKNQQVDSGAQIGELRRLLSEARAARATADERATLFRTVALRLKKQVDAGDLLIVVRDGRMVLRLPDDVLFDTGRTELKPAGKEALAAIADVLAPLGNRHFQVSGHTDNVPIRTARYPSNWELSSARALQVLRFLVSKGLSAPLLSAAAYADVDPVGDNGTPDGRKRNRRTEITLQPDISDIVQIPGDPK